MAQTEEDYLHQCLKKNICPVCQKSIIKKFGSGQLKDGVFCSLDCYGKWHQGLMAKRHQEHVKKDASND